MMDDMKLLTKEETADLMGLNVEQLSSLRKRGLIPYVRVSERIIRFNEADIKALVEKRTFKFTK